MNVVMEKPKVSVKVENRVVEKEVIKEVIVEKEVPVEVPVEVEKTKYGVSIDNLLGDVDENGTLLFPQTSFVVNLAGVKRISGTSPLQCLNQTRIEEFYAEDLEIFSFRAFHEVFNTSSNLRIAVFGCEEIAESFVFQNCFPTSSVFSGFGNDIGFFFPKLKKITGASAFYGAFQNIYFTGIRAYYFPVLEEISGDSVFNGNKYNIRLPAVKKITGGTSASSSTFLSSAYGDKAYVYLPAVEDLSAYVFGKGVAEVHFSAKNRATIESLSGYSNKFGGVNATLYFDLITTITVNSVVYNRNDVNSIYGNSSAKLEWAAWADESGNLVYTDATAEPAVGTVVYSDQGTTQVGTVTEVA